MSDKAPRMLSAMHELRPYVAGTWMVEAHDIPRFDAIAIVGPDPTLRLILDASRHTVRERLQIAEKIAKILTAAEQETPS